MKILVTGANGFIGKNLCVELKNKGFVVLTHDIDKSEKNLAISINEADFIVHLAGINRPQNAVEFYGGNASFTKRLVDLVIQSKKSIPILYSSSIQAELDNDYGKSKKMAEEYLFDFMAKSNNPVFVYRLANVFGKWCEPNYNSVVATFCHNIANGLPIVISDRSHSLKLVYIDDVVKEFIRCISYKKDEYGKGIRGVQPTFDLSLGELADKLHDYEKKRDSLLLPDLESELDRKLYATFLSYYKTDLFARNLKMNLDQHGSFTEMFKTLNAGQVSVNISKPGFVKGNHYHHTKIEKFFVVSGECEIKFRKIGTREVFTYIVNGSKIQMVDIPPGYTHSIKNIGTVDSITIIWASEIFDEENPDAYYEEVEANE